jgi:alpha-ketoglutarate-dependent taurine dioxygenase
MNAGADRLRQSIDEQIAKTQAITVNWSNGMTLIIDNRRMLHARGRASCPDKDRIISRMLIGGG